MHSTNYQNAFILVAADCAVTEGMPPAKPETVAAIQYALIVGEPYRFTSDEVLVEVLARRRGIEGGREALKAELFSKPQACLRASPLVKLLGYGLHHDANGRVAAYGMETQRYQELARDPALKILPGMRSKRA